MDKPIEHPMEFAWALALRARQCPSVVRAKAFLLQVLDVMGGGVSDDPAKLNAAVDEKIKNGSDADKVLFVRGCNALMQVAFVIGHQGVVAQAGSVNDGRSRERLEVATLFLLEQAWDHLLTDPDVRFAHAIANGSQTWK